MSLRPKIPDFYWAKIDGRWEPVEVLLHKDRLVVSMLGRRQGEPIDTDLVEGWGARMRAPISMAEASDPETSHVE
jgi:hypothetical protein